MDKKLLLIQDLKKGENEGILKARIIKLDSVKQVRTGKPVRNAEVQDSAGITMRIDFWESSAYAIKEGDEIQLKNPYLKENNWNDKIQMQLVASRYEGGLKILNREVEGFK